MRAYVPSERALLRNRVCQGGMAQGLSWQHAGAAAGPLGGAIAAACCWKVVRECSVAWWCAARARVQPTLGSLQL